MSLSTSEVVLRFLATIGRRSEAAEYLALFRSEEPESFAIIAVDEDVMTHDRDALVFDLQYLARLDLRPTLVLESGESAEALTQRLDGSVALRRVSSAEAAKKAARSGEVPILVLPRDGGEGREPCQTLSGLASALHTRKVVFLGRGGGIVPVTGPHVGSLISFIDLTTEYRSLTRPGVLPESQLRLLREGHRLIQSAEHSMTVAITSPLELLRELFTVGGAGTLLRRGATIRAHSSYDELDRGRLDSVMKSAFDVAAPESFYRRPVERIYVAGDFDGAAIVAPTSLVPYLTKFAVSRVAQGAGIGRDLWRALTAEHSSLLWRSRQVNPICEWYVKLCDGMMRVDPWCVFWRRVPTPRIPEAVEIVTSQPVDFPLRTG